MMLGTKCFAATRSPTGDLRARGPFARGDRIAGRVTYSLAGTQGERPANTLHIRKSVFEATVLEDLRIGQIERPWIKMPP